MTKAGGSAASRRRAAALLAYGALTIGSWVLLAPRTRLPVDLELGWWVCGALVPVFLVAALLVAQLPGHGVGRVLATMACAHATGIAAGVAGAWLAQQDLAGAGLLRWLAAVSWVGTLPLLAVLVLIFPTGRPPSPRWWPVLYAQLAAVAVLTVLVAVAPRGVPAQPLAAVAGVVLLGTGMLAAVSQVVRWRAARGAERAQLRAFAVLAAVLALSYVVAGLLKLTGLGGTWPNLDAVSYLTLIAGLPVAVGLAVLRHRLYGIDPLVNRVLVWAMVSAVLLGAYLVVIAATTALLGGSRSPAPVALVAAAVVALALAPVRARAQGLVDRLMYGDRGDPVRILRALGVRLSATVAPDEVARTLTETLTGTLRLPWAAVDLDREGQLQRMAEAGDPGAARQPVTIPLTHAGEQVGRLLVQPRRGEATLTRADRQLLADLAAHAGPAVHAARLVDQLTESRERLVQVREAERGRLRRDLHDSLSPALAGIGLSADAAGRVLGTDPEAAAALLAGVVAEARASTETIRRLLADLRPPGLEELGLVAALEERARQLSRPGEFEVELRIADPLAPLAPGVEVAAYRIAVEALTNAARHSGGRRCCLELSTDQLLRLTVTDDGHGLSSPNGEGAGIRTMRERARELGGRLTIGPADGAGVRVVAELPTLGGAMTMVRVLVAEDHPMFRDALAATLTLAGGFEVVAAVGSGEDAVAEALRRTPDVVVMDLEMPGGGGVAATAEILRQLPATRILVLTSYDEDRLVYAALRAGAHGYVLKSATTEEIVRAVQTVAQGDGLFAGSVVERISRHLATGGRASGPTPFPELTQREREILELMAQGHSNAYIADHFVLSLKTVRNHVSSVLAKLGASTRAQAVVKARQAGLGGRDAVGG